MIHDWQSELDRVVERQFSSLVQLRRHLHMHPELPGEERETTSYISSWLENSGYNTQTGPDGRGLIADFPPRKGQPPLPRIALRADLDGLRIQDSKQVPYHSQVNGVMHACGHDAHTALVAGALSAICELAQRGHLPWPVSLRGIFQPAEETCQGAKEMIEFGALEQVEAIFATHMDPLRSIGHVGLRRGMLTANCDEVLLTISGRGGHAARPHETSDPIAAAAQLINAIYVSLPRLTDSQDAVVVTIGQISGGANANVIPEKVQLRGTVRTLDQKVRDQTLEHLQRLADGVGSTTRTAVTLTLGPGAPGVFNDHKLFDLVRCCAREVVDENGLDCLSRPSMGSEDFAFYLQQVPGFMLRIGSLAAHVQPTPLHTPDFDIDENAITVGARILARIAIHWSNPNRALLENTDLHQRGAGI